jgi:hypothetical protein
MLTLSSFSKVCLVGFSCLLTVSCNDYTPDAQTLNFTTEEGVKTSLDTDLEFYRVDDKPGIYYINFRYYKKNKDNQWSLAAKIDGPWRVYPDQAMVPKQLLAL